MTALLGCDYSFSRPGGARLASLGVKFAARYYSTAGNAKNLTAEEVRDLTAHGIDIVSVFETNGEEAKAGYRQGTVNAASAVAQAKRLGQPSGSVIYFAVDFGPNTAQLNSVVEYFQGLKNQIRDYRVGVYGGLDTVHRVMAEKLATHAWQTIAWSRGVRSPLAAIYQDGSTFPGLPDVDRDFALHIDYGGWHGQKGAPPTTHTGSGTGEIAVQMQTLENNAVIAVRGTDGYLWMKEVGRDGEPVISPVNGNPLSWQRYFPVGSAPALATRNGDDLYIAYLNDKQGVEIAHTPDPFTVPPTHNSSLGGILVSAPSINCIGAKITVIGEGLKHEIYRNTFTGSAWTGWLDEHGQAK